MQDTGYIGFYPGSRIPNPASIGAEMAQTTINAMMGDPIIGVGIGLALEIGSKMLPCQPNPGGPCL
jgi:hypothetical protein